MQYGNSLAALESPPPAVLWLAVVPLSIAVGRWIGDLLDLFFPPPAEGVDWAKLGAVGGGLYGIAFYITVIVVA